MAIDRRDRFVACLVAGAAGDALGATVEFDRLRDIRGVFGDAGLTGHPPGRMVRITDDTQMTLFTAEGLIRAEARARTEGVVDATDMVHRAYLRWLDTQGERSKSAGPRGWLVDEPLLRHRRAPGNTCLSALGSGRAGSPTHPVNDSKGCGGVMRVAPVGLVDRSPFRLGGEVAALTHTHPSGYLPAAVLASMVAGVVRGQALPDALADARLHLPGWPGAAETEAALAAAVSLAGGGPPSPERLERLGEGWVGEEALAIAVYCVLAEPDVRRSLLLAVNHSGDSDSTGAIAGNLLGAMHGTAALPAALVEPVAERALVERVAHDLADTFVDKALPDADRYPPA